MQGDRYSGWWPLLAWFQCTYFTAQKPRPGEKKSLQFPDLLHQTAVGVTFSYAKPVHIIQKFGPAQMSKWETSICCYETEQGKERPFYSAALEEMHMLYSGACVIDWMKLAVFIAWILKPSAENTWFVCIYKLAQWSQFVDAQRGLTNTANDRSDQTELPLQIPIN